MKNEYGMDYSPVEALMLLHKEITNKIIEYEGMTKERYERWLSLLETAYPPLILFHK